ncbi:MULTISPECIES: hypothetical protein [Niastella]|uniref:Uncharacterized protein n=1 Tax=Niastella soli TaxID=2821487 RepID=A0ABS3YXF9_9BACT|nr:hypothetical protein [Niastella soli]MBO9202438.1 hypothetical protein [Niastella soli]
MKSLLLLGATLMVGAGIYGFVDYKKREQSAAFRSLYREEKAVVQQPTPEVVTSPAPIVTEPTVKKEMVVETKKPAQKKVVKETYKRISTKAFSRAIPKEAAIEDMELPVEEPAPTPIKKAL